jgi:hypothetical protein
MLHHSMLQNGHPGVAKLLVLHDMRTSIMMVVVATKTTTMMAMKL